MKCTLISQEALEAAFEKKLEEPGISEEKTEFISEAICLVLDQPSMFPDAEASARAYWRECRNDGQNTTWWECSNCSTLGSPRWKRCPVCEAKMRV